MRNHILEEIRRLAEKHGKAPGRQVFEKETGISKGEWLGKHWARWGDAVKEAGFEPNKMQGKLPSESVLEKFAEAMRHFKKVPTTSELQMFGRDRSDFPSHATFSSHFEGMNRLVDEFRKWAEKHSEFADLVELLPNRPEGEEFNEPSQATQAGMVYLLRSGDHYKIGRSDNVEKRIKQIAVAMPEVVTLVHTIRTDDPPGIEAYWHRRFAERRAGGEWFKLSAADLKAFKRHKVQ